MATYGVDCLDPRVSLRRVHVLLDNLPPQARRPGEQWSTEAELLAVLIDHVAQLTWVTLKAAGAKNVARPQPVKRPAHRALPRPAAQPDDGEPGRVKAATWGEAAQTLATIPGVVIHDG
jgi:hypothetical protein